MDNNVKNTDINLVANTHQDRYGTSNNCTAQDMVPVGSRFIFGYNVHMGLKAVTELEDVFAVYEFSDGAMHEQPLDAFCTLPA